MRLAMSWNWGMEYMRVYYFVYVCLNISIKVQKKYIYREKESLLGERCFDCMKYVSEYLTDLNGFLNK